MICYISSPVPQLIIDPQGVNPWAKMQATVRLLNVEGVFNTSFTLREVKPWGINTSFSFVSFKLAECFLVFSKYKCILPQSQNMLQRNIVLLRMKT